MAEWKTDTEEVKKVVGKCRDFKKTLQEERCFGFIKDLDSYARGILVERRKIEHQLLDAIKELGRAKKKEESFWGFLLGDVRDIFDMAGEVIPPAKLGAEACDKVLNLMKENTEKWEKM